MTDKKISELPAASAITGAEVMPIVQAGNTVKASASSITGMVAAPTGIAATDTANLQAASTAGKTVKLHAGTYLVNATLAPTANTVFQGDGKGRTIIKFQNATATLGGIICATNLTVRDMTLQADVNGQTWCATHIYSQACTNVLFENVEFKGTTVKLGNWASWVSNANASHIRYVNCSYELLTFGVGKDNADTSVQRDWVWSGCNFFNLTDGLTVNSPVGAWSIIKVTDCDFETISQFPVSFAGTNCRDSKVSGCSFRDIEYEALHYEANTHVHKVIGNDFELTNTTAGVVGSAGAMNGAIQAITGSYDIQITKNTFDLRQNTTGSPNGVVVQGGGGASPHNVVVSGNTFLLKAGTIAIFGQNIGLATAGLLDISDNVFENQTVSKSSKILELLLCVISGGNNSFINPGVVLNADDNSYGGLRDSSFVGDLSTFDFLTGTTNAATAVVFQNFQIKREFTVDSAGNWQTICPDGSLYDGIVSLRYVGNGASDSFNQTSQLTGDSGVLTIASGQANAVGGVDPNLSPRWQSSGGNLQSHAFRASSQTGTVLFTFQGAWFA